MAKRQGPLRDTSKINCVKVEKFHIRKLYFIFTFRSSDPQPTRQPAARAGGSKQEFITK
jgi:hypothetical protein